MGQLEKYGLYVLCLVIFLILGVTIWGGGDLPAGKTPTASIRSAAPSGGGPAAPGGQTPNPMADEMKSLAEALLDPGTESRRPAVQGGGEPKPAPKTTTEPAQDDPKDGPKTAPAPAPAVRATYKVQEGDSFDSIARAKLGRAAARDELMKANPGIEPRKLRPGMELVLPAVDAVAGGKTAEGKAADGKTAEASARKALDKPIAAPPDGARTYVVKKGDNFERIAIAELGSRKRTSELLELNAGVDPAKLRPGTTLKLPKK